MPEEKPRRRRSDPPEDYEPTRMDGLRELGNSPLGRAIAFAGVLGAALWAMSDIRSEVPELRGELRVLREQVQVNAEAIDQLEDVDNRLIAVEARADAVEMDIETLGEGVERAVQRGIKRGVERALQEIRAGNS